MLGLARPESTDAKVAVEAREHALENLLIRLPRRGQDHLAVARVTADQAAGRHQHAERARIDVLAADGGGNVNLAGNIAALFGPGLGRHHRLLSVDEKESLQRSQKRESCRAHWPRRR